jgi:hypothetical protein
MDQFTKFVVSEVQATDVSDNRPLQTGSLTINSRLCPAIAATGVRETSSGGGMPVVGFRHPASFPDD